MKTYAFYHTKTGDLHPVIVSCENEATLKANAPPEHEPLEHENGSILPYRHRIDIASKKVVDRPDSKLKAIPIAVEHMPIPIEQRIAALERELTQLKSAQVV